MYFVVLLIEACFSQHLHLPQEGLDGKKRDDRQKYQVGVKAPEGFGKQLKPRPDQIKIINKGNISESSESSVAQPAPTASSITQDPVSPTSVNDEFDSLRPTDYWSTGSDSDTKKSSFTPSLQPTISPSPSYLNVNGVTAVSGDVSQPIVLSGTGTITNRNSGQPLIFDDVTVNPGSNISARSLTIKVRLNLSGSAVLSAESEGKIVVQEGVQMVFTIIEEKVPQLNLGAIGSNYNIRPGMINITLIPVEDPTEETDSEVSSWEIISGRTLGNCNDWLDAIRVDPLIYYVDCQEKGSGVHLFDEDNVKSVFLRKASSGGLSIIPGNVTDAGLSVVVKSVVGVAAGVVIIAIYIIVLVLIGKVNRTKSPPTRESDLIED